MCTLLAVCCVEVTVAQQPGMRGGSPTTGAHPVVQALQTEQAARATAEEALASCRSQFEVSTSAVPAVAVVWFDSRHQQTYSSQAAAWIEECNGNIHLLNKQAVELDSSLRTCVAQVQDAATGGNTPCPSAPERIGVW